MRFGSYHIYQHRNHPLHIFTQFRDARRHSFSPTPGYPDQRCLFYRHGEKISKHGRSSRRHGERWLMPQRGPLMPGELPSTADGKRLMRGRTSLMPGAMSSMPRIGNRMSGGSFTMPGRPISLGFTQRTASARVALRSASASHATGRDRSLAPHL